MLIREPDHFIDNLNLREEVRRKAVAMSREDTARLIAKIHAYLACGKPESARAYALQLIDWLEAI
jgi:hypothetical protein